MNTRSEDSRLRLYANPLRLLCSASLARAAAFLLSYLVVGVVLFALVVTTSATSAALAFTLIAIPLLIGAAWVVHGCAAVQRALLRLTFATAVPVSYRQPDKPGLLARAAAAWRSKATWREIAYLVGLFGPLFILDAVVLMVWVTFAGLISMPLWYSRTYDAINGHRYYGISAGYFPHGPSGAGARGIFIHTLPEALIGAAVFAVLFLLFSYVVVLVARLHARIARAILRPPTDPLADAKTVLSSPGPLGPLTPIR